MYIKTIIKNNDLLKWKECNYDVWIYKILYSIKIAVMTNLEDVEQIFFDHSEKPYPHILIHGYDTLAVS